MRQPTEGEAVDRRTISSVSYAAPTSWPFAVQFPGLRVRAGRVCALLEAGPRGARSVAWGMCAAIGRSDDHRL